ncbi:MAG: nitroreductase family protein [Bdellovibrionales bacterium]|nr:nitroreductase family protein [Bdellovibrionales bacterium]
MLKLPNPSDFRSPDHPIEEIFWRRWSPRAMSSEVIPDSELLRLFEAARWAPSTYNEQEWRFLFAKRDSSFWNIYFEALFEANQSWCKNAGALVAVLSHKIFSRNGKPNPVHTFDAGAAFQNLALQGSVMGLVVHGMAGFDKEKLRADLGVPSDYSIEAMIAIGKPAPASVLTEELREREFPSGRKPVSEISAEGLFSFS